MKLQECLEMAAICGLGTYGEAYDNVRIHSANLFTYYEMNKEMTELTTEMCKDTPEYDRRVSCI